MPERALQVLESGPLTCVQDLGRPGLAHLGVPRSGALDAPASALANRLVGNPEPAATLECLDGRLRFRVTTGMTVAVTGARTQVWADGRPVAWGEAVTVSAGTVVALGPATQGLRAYLAVSGGVVVPEVLGSRATDQLSGLGPAPVCDGDVLPVGAPGAAPVAVDVQRPTRPGGPLRLRRGPRDEWFEPGSLARLEHEPYTVSSTSNRIGLRLEGPALRRTHAAELPSEGMVLGAVQVPPSGQPVVFLHDHPTTGGYPVIGVVVAEDLAVCAQLRPGEQVRFQVVG